MSYSPPPYEWMPPCIDTGRIYAHDIHTYTTSGSSGGTAWPSANLALFIPWYIFKPATIQSLYTLNGTVSGNIDVGWYDESGNKIFTAGSTAQAGVVQAFACTINVSYGRYWFGVALDNATGQLRRWTNGTGMANIQKAFGMAQMTSAFPLPATITFAACTNAYVPHIGINFTSQAI